MAVSAVRIPENVDLLEYAVPADRVMPVRDEPHFANADEETLAGIAITWQEWSKQGLTEAEFRQALRDTYPAFADREIPEFRPFGWVEPAVAALLIANEWAEPVAPEGAEE